MFQPGIAQLVQTSTGKHILLTPTANANISTSIAIPGSTTGKIFFFKFFYLFYNYNIFVVVTTGGQRLTLLPKQAVTTGQVTKGLPKIQLMSVNNPVQTVSATVYIINL